MQVPVEFILFSQNDIHLDFSVNGPWVSHYLIIREGLLKKLTSILCQTSRTHNNNLRNKKILCEIYLAYFSQRTALLFHRGQNM